MVTRSRSKNYQKSLTGGMYSGIAKFQVALRLHQSLEPAL